MNEKKSLDDYVKAATEENPVILGAEKGPGFKTVWVDNPIYKKEG
jgi:hypothetical protein